MRGSKRPVSSQHDRHEGGSTVTKASTNRITLRAPGPETPRSSSLATTGDRRTGGLPMAESTSASDRVPRSTLICTLVSKKAIIDIARAHRPGGIPQHGVRAQPLLFFSQQRVDELRLRGDPARTHELAQAGFRNADRDGAGGSHAKPEARRHAQSIVVEMLHDDHLEHRLVSETPFRPLGTELLDQVMVQRDRRRPGAPEHFPGAGPPDVFAEVAPLELLHLGVHVPAFSLLGDGLLHRAL